MSDGYGLFLDCDEDDGITDEDFELHVLNDPDLSDGERDEVMGFDDARATSTSTPGGGS